MRKLLPLVFFLVCTSVFAQTKTIYTDKLVLSNPTAGTDTNCLYIASDGTVKKGACGSSVTLDQVGNPVASKTFNLGAYTLGFLGTAGTQFTFGYDASNNFTVGVGSTGVTTLGINTSTGTNPTRIGFTTSRSITFSGTNDTMTETALGVRRLVVGLGLDSPRVLFEDSSTVWQIDNSAGTFRWYLPSNTRMTMSATALTNYGTLDQRGAISDGDSNLSLNDNTDVTGTFSASGLASLNGGIAVDSTAFTVADATGNTVVGGTLQVTGNTTLTGDIAVNGSDITASGSLNITPAGGDVKLNPSANIVVDPTSRYILPGGPYSEILGAPFNKFLQIHTAELVLDRLVSRNVTATQSGYLLVTPTTSLTATLGPALTDTTMTVKDNIFTTNDVVRLEARGNVEFLTVGSTGSAQVGTLATSNGTADPGATGASETWSQTVDSTGANRLLLVGCAFVNTGSATITSVTYAGPGGLAANLAYQTAATNGTAMRAELWWMADPQVGTGTVTVTFSASVAHDCGAIVMRDARQTVPFHSTTTNTGASGSPLVGVAPISTGDIAVGVMGTTNNAACTPGASETEYWDDGTTGVRGYGVTEPYSVSVNLQPTCSSGVWAAIGVAVYPITNGYNYTVTRDSDGTGRNQWIQGDAVVQTGQTNSGWLELYAENSIRSGTGAGVTEVGPTIIANKRTSGTFNAWEPRAAFGHLNGLYSQASGTYGLAAGTPGGTNVLLTDANGLQFRNSTTVYGSFNGTTLTLGNTSSDNVNITSTRLEFRDGSTVRGYLDGNQWVLGEIANDRHYLSMTPTSVNLTYRTPGGVDSGRLSLDATNGLRLFDSAGVARITLDTSGNATFNGSITAGSTITGATVQTVANCGTAANGCVRMNGSNLAWYDGTPTQIGLIDGNGISIPARQTTTPEDLKTYKFSSVNNGALQIWGESIPSGGSPMNTITLGALATLSGNWANAGIEAYNSNTTKNAWIEALAGGSATISYNAADGHTFSGVAAFSSGITLSSASLTGTYGPGNDTAYTVVEMRGASSSWPMAMSGIYNANYVDHYLTFNGKLGGTYAAPTLTVPSSTYAGWLHFTSSSGLLEYATRATSTGAPTVRFSVDNAGAVNATSYKVGGTAGFSGTKTAGACTFTISGGVITNVTGC